MPKILLEHQGQRLIDHIARPIMESGLFEKIVFVLSPKHGQQVIEYVDQWSRQMTFSFVWQNEPLGFGHAVLQARDEVFSFRKWNPLVLIATDDGIRSPSNPHKAPADLIKTLVSHDKSALGVQWRGNVRDHGMVVLGMPDGVGYATRPNSPRPVTVERLVEKPYWDEGGLCMTGLYFVRESRRLFRNLNKLVKAKRVLNGEHQLTHALQMMIDAGTPFTTYYHEWTDVGSK